jgi:hypothetical protein
MSAWALGQHPSVRQDEIVGASGAAQAVKAHILILIRVEIHAGAASRELAYGFLPITGRGVYPASTNFFALDQEIIHAAPLG